MTKPLSAPPPRKKPSSLGTPSTPVGDIKDSVNVSGKREAAPKTKAPTLTIGGKGNPFKTDLKVTVNKFEGEVKGAPVKLIARPSDNISIGVRYGHYIVTGKSDIDSDGREYVCRCICEANDVLYYLPENELQARPLCDHHNGSFERPDYIPFTRHMVNRYKELIELYDVAEEFNTFEKFCLWWSTCGTTKGKALVNIKPHKRAHPNNMRFVSPHLVNRYRELAAIRCAFYQDESFLSLALKHFGTLKKVNKELSYKKYKGDPLLVERAIVARHVKETF